MHLKLLGLTLLFVVSTTLVHAQTETTTTTDIPIQQQSIVTSFDPLNTEDVEARIREEFADIPVLIKIAQCESGFRQFDSSGHPLFGGSGGMVGIFQLAAVIHNDAAKNLQFDITSLEGNAAYARYLYEHEGVRPWLASASCWNPQNIHTTLTLGTKSAEVKKLQQTLNSIGYAVAKTGDGSLGQESTVFGPMTALAVKKFQCDKGIVCSGTEKTSGYGAVGAKTRLALTKAALKVTASKTSTTLSEK